MFSPSGTMKHHVIHLKQKYQEWARKVRHSTLSRHEAYTAMTLTIWKTIEYSLLATTMSEAQCNEIISIVLMAGLPKSGICRYADRDPIFSSFKYQGFGLKHPYFLQGLKKLTLLLGPIDATNRFLLTESYQQLLCETGLGKNIFQFNPAQLSPIAKTHGFTAYGTFAST